MFLQTTWGYSILSLVLTDKEELITEKNRDKWSWRDHIYNIQAEQSPDQ